MVDMVKLRQAIEASWEPAIAYMRQEEDGNPALGQCYPTSWVMQQYFAELEIVEGDIVTPSGREKHFWNILRNNGQVYHIDLTWQQFPVGSYVDSWWVRDRRTLNDGEETKQRCALLKSKVERVLNYDSVAGST